MALVGNVIITVAVTHGQFRYRTPAEATIVVLSAVALESVGRAKRLNPNRA
jgi:hypothetical protein